MCPKLSNRRCNHVKIRKLRCSTPSVRRPGCAYLDTCVSYIDTAERTLVEVDRSPDNNIYVRIPHALLDPILAAAEERLTHFYSTTFWCNINVFQCQQVGRFEYLATHVYIR